MGPPDSKAKASPNAPGSMLDRLGTELVTLYVGKKRKEIVVHKKLLADSSDYFYKAFMGPFLESHEAEMYLPEDSEAAYALYIEWLCRGALAPGINKEDTVKFYELYYLAEKLCDQQHLADLAMDSLRDLAKRLETRPSMSRVRSIFANTKQKSPLRFYIVHLLMHYSWVKRLQKAEDDAYAESDTSSEDVHILK